MSFQPVCYRGEVLFILHNYVLSVQTTNYQILAKAMFVFFPQNVEVAVWLCHKMCPLKAKHPVILKLFLLLSIFHLCLFFHLRGGYCILNRELTSLFTTQMKCFLVKESRIVDCSILNDKVGYKANKWGRCNYFDKQMNENTTNITHRLVHLQYSLLKGYRKEVKLKKINVWFFQVCFTNWTKRLHHWELITIFSPFLWVIKKRRMFSNSPMLFAL